MSKHRNNQQWLELITECRQSGMTDMDWCRTNGISHSTFYKAIHRLQEAACKLPESLACSSTILNLTSAKQDIVPISIIPDTSNDISPSLLSHTLHLLGGAL